MFSLSVISLVCYDGGFKDYVMLINAHPVRFFKGEQFFTIFACVLSNDDKVLKQEHSP